MNDKKAIVIGVGPEAGLGARLAQRFASLGLHVFVAGRTQADLDRVVNSITTNHGKATAVVTDATDEAAVIALFDRAQAAPGGQLDVAIYNAGNNTPGPYRGNGCRVFRTRLARRLLRRVFVRPRSGPQDAAEQTRHVVVHRRERVDARPRELRRVQLGQRRAAQPRPSDGEGIRARIHSRRARRDRRSRSAATKSCAGFPTTRIVSAKKA